MKVFATILFVIAFSFNLYSQQTVDVEKGKSVVVSWNEVMSLLKVNPDGTKEIIPYSNSRKDFYYQIYIALIDSNGVAQWGTENEFKLLENNWQPTFTGSGSLISFTSNVSVPAGKYQLVVTCYRYNSKGIKLESDPSSELIFINVIDVIDNLPPLKPGKVQVILNFN